MSLMMNEPPVLCGTEAECEREMSLAVIRVACGGQISRLSHSYRVRGPGSLRDIKPDRGGVEFSQYSHQGIKRAVY